jgi:hypothetical protein
LAALFGWDPHVIPQYGADGEGTGAGEAAAAGASPTATANTAVNSPVLWINFIVSPQNIPGRAILRPVQVETGGYPRRCFLGREI